MTTQTEPARMTGYGAETHDGRIGSVAPILPGAGRDRPRLLPTIREGAPSGARDRLVSHP
jgi:hypothetical protein